MNITITHGNADRALAPGADIWLTFPNQNSRWTQKLDWYLNFALSKWEVHVPHRLAPELKAMLYDEELECDDLNLSRDVPLLIASHDTFPNAQFIVLPSTPTCFVKIPSLLGDLRAGSVRIFMPDTAEPAAFESKLLKLDWQHSVWESDVRVELIPPRIITE
jgi:hypothetical protein